MKKRGKRKNSLLNQMGPSNGEQRNCSARALLSLRMTMLSKQARTTEEQLGIQASKGNHFSGSLKCCRKRISRKDTHLEAHQFPWGKSTCGCGGIFTGIPARNRWTVSQDGSTPALIVNLKHSHLNQYSPLITVRLLLMAHVLLS